MASPISTQLTPTHLAACLEQHINMIIAEESQRLIDDATNQLRQRVSKRIIEVMPKVNMLARSTTFGIDLNIKITIDGAPVLPEPEQVSLPDANSPAGETAQSSKRP